MRQMKIARQTATRHPHRSMERRCIPRVPVSFGLMYSAISGDDVLMGDGIVVDLSKDGLGIRGNHPVKIGMELTLFLYLPDGEDPLFVLEANVAWTAGHLFGVEFKKLSLREGNRLHSFLLAQSIQQA
ncbi:MAG: PilZ domain-containing protein [Nitrospira sp.]|nr:MAG: PilZ domain-containing protein [Nitrospira sp.]